MLSVSLLNTKSVTTSPGSTRTKFGVKVTSFISRTTGTFAARAIGADANIPSEIKAVATTTASGREARKGFGRPKRRAQIDFASSQAGATKLYYGWAPPPPGGEQGGRGGETFFL